VLVVQKELQLAKTSDAKEVNCTKCSAKCTVTFTSLERIFYYYFVIELTHMKTVKLYIITSVEVERHGQELNWTINVKRFTRSFLSQRFQWYEQDKLP
jgi:cell division protein FtsL